MWVYLYMTDAAWTRRMEDRLARLQEREAPRDREIRQREERAKKKKEGQEHQFKHHRVLQEAKYEDEQRTKEHKMRTKQQAKVTKLIAEMHTSTENLTTALPESKGGGGEVGKLSQHYNRAMKTMGSFITHYAKSNPDTNPDWYTLSPKRQRELVHFHQSLASNAQHHRAVSQLNTAKKHAEAFAAEAEKRDFRDAMSPANQQKLDVWMKHLDIPVAKSLVSAPVVAQVISSSAKPGTGGRKTRKRKRKRNRKTRKRKKKTRKRKPKKRHRRTKRR